MPYITGYLTLTVLTSGGWRECQASPWEGELGRVDSQELELIPEHIRNRLEVYESAACEDANVDHDRNSSAHVNDNDEYNMALLRTVEEPLLPATAGGPVRIVRKLLHDQCRSRLVEHFDILYKKNAIKWPRRFGRSTSPGIVGDRKSVV